MSWKSGGDLFETVVDIVDTYVESQEARQVIYERVVREFSMLDCDVLEYGLDRAVRDPLSLRAAFVATRYWEEDQRYGEYICKTHFQQYTVNDYDSSQCPDC